jgi:hypothetical protein
MVAHQIQVRLANGEIVLADPNPLHVNEGDTVTWAFVNDDDSTAIGGLRVEMQVFLPNNHTTPTVATHPFVQFSSSLGTTAGPFTVSNSRAGIYLYAVIDSAGHIVKWRIPLFVAGRFVAFFGGIVKPVGPP